MTQNADLLPTRKVRAETGLSKDRLRLWLKLLKVSRRLEQEIQERFRSEFATTLPRFDVLAALNRAEREMRMSELSQALKTSNGNLTGIVDRLVSDGLLQRVAVPGDRRAMAVRLTPEGKLVFARLAAAHEGWVDEMLGCFEAEEIGALIASLGRIADRPAGKEMSQ